MNRFWNILMQPIIEAVNANYIVEIGSDTGINTRNILDYCRDHDAHMTSIDPAPKFDINKFKEEYGDKFEIYEELSLKRLPFLDDYDVILIDGDHNWYTVYNELKIIEKQFKNKKFPLIFLHDIGWPYGRRDLYYNPENIPQNYRQPYKKLGMYPNQRNLKESGGANTHLNNAIYEDTPNNGVLTALEDFIKESRINLSFDFVNLFYGLGIVYVEEDTKTKKIVEECIKSVDFLGVLEEERVKSSITHSNLIKQNSSLKNKLNKNKVRINDLQVQIETHNQLIEKNNEHVKELNVKLEELGTNLYKMSYLNNEYKSPVQRIISKFPSLYILFKGDNHGIKNALTNIKGYRAIKKNNLLDIGYYLKNNEDVRKSGVNPLLHYIYHGFKEGRTPNPRFDADFYLKTRQDVKNSNLNPLIHYGLYGMKEERKNYLNNLESKFKVSIIMPTYNREYIIKRAIDSILHQTFSNYELIICDDGSTDNTEKLLKKDYANYFKSGKFIYLKQEHFGVSKARNMGLKRSNGNLIAYLDTDNYWESKFLEKMVSLFQENPTYDSAYAALQVHDLIENKDFVLNYTYDRDGILKDNHIDINVFLHRRKLYELRGGFNESLKRLVDWDLILRYTQNKDPLFLNEILAQYYIKENYNNISTQENFKEHRDEIYNLHSDEIISRALSETNFVTDPFITSLYLQSTKPIDNSYLKVAVFLEGELKSLKSCPYLRLYSPLKHLSLKEKEKFEIFVYDKEIFDNLNVNKIMKCKLFDVIIIQRGAIGIEAAKIILNTCKNNKTKVIYELDDNLLSIDKNNRNYTFFKNKIEAMEYLIKNSDLVTVSTNALSKRFKEMNKNVVVRNYLVNELKPIKDIKPKDDIKSIEIGYFGTLTHDDDLVMIKDPLCNIIKKFKENYGIDVKFYIIGGMNKETDESWFTKVEIPSDSTDFIPFINWIKSNVNYDILVAPLKDTVFNEAKSELKYIEYTALGAPGIYSDLPPYNSVVQDGLNGLLAKNSDEWEIKLEKLILDQNLRTEIVKNAQKDIKKNYLLEYRVEEWKNILQNITQTEKSQNIKKIETPQNFKISIILPIYNMEKYLRKTLESIERQTIGLENLEVIMINEASTDGSRSIIDEYEDKYENFVAVHLSKSSGTPGKPRNIGIEIANGEYIMFIDHDDFYSDDACEILYNKISKEGADIVSGIYNFVYGDDIRELNDKKIFENKNEIKVENISEKENLLTLPPVVWSKIFRRSFIINNSLQFPVGVLAEDLIFLSIALLKAKGIIFLNYPIYNYRVLDTKGETSLSQTRDKKWFKGICDARKIIWDTYQKEGKEEYFRYICEYSLNYLLAVFTLSNMNFNDKYEVLEYMYWIFKKADDYGIKPPKRFENLFNTIIRKDYETAIILSETFNKPVPNKNMNITSPKN